MVHRLFKKKRVREESAVADPGLPEISITGPAAHFNPER
jgi:hypothetical protein